MLVSNQITDGSVGYPKQQTYTSYGAIMAAAMKKAYNHIENSFMYELPMRSFAAWNEVNTKSCADYFGLVLTPERTTTVCASFDFTKLTPNLMDLV